MAGGPPRVVALDPDGQAVSLGEWAVDHLRQALRTHLAWCHRSGIDAPRDLVALAVAVSAGGGSGRLGGREDAAAVAAGDAGRVMSYREAAEVFGVSTRTLRRWRAAGRVRGIGRRLVVEVPLVESGDA